jgi:hypothetical protein
VERQNSEFFLAFTAVVRRPGFLVGLLIAIALAVLWYIERFHAWANNWLPNFIAEWTGILIAVALLDQLRQQRNEARVRPLRLHAYRAFLRWLDHVGLVASDYLERWVTDSGERESTRNASEAVRRMDEAFARDAVPDPNTRRCWVEMLRYDAAEIDKICARYLPFLPPPVTVPTLAGVDAMRASADSFGEEKNSWGVGTYGGYTPFGDDFVRAYAAVTRALSDTT